MKKILITGGSGYIGSCLYFYIKKIFNVQTIDKKKNKLLKTYSLNLLDFKKLNKFLSEFKPDLVIHLAAQSLVDEKINKEKYFNNNVKATQNLIKAMKENNINNIIFSSTAAVYKYNYKTLKENNTLKPVSAYSKTKLNCEKIIKNSKINYVILRFFNVCSSIKVNKKIIGEYHNPETHLIPTVVYKNILKKKFFIYGNNYNTNDGTCIRDYVHIRDICSAIKNSVYYLFKNSKRNHIINIGSSFKNTNLQILKEIEKITKIKNNFEIVKRRKGDVDILVCSNSKAKYVLKWKPVNSNLSKIIRDEIAWVKYLIKNKMSRKFKKYF